MGPLFGRPKYSLLFVGGHSATCSSEKNVRRSALRRSKARLRRSHHIFYLFSWEVVKIQGIFVGCPGKGPRAV